MIADVPLLKSVLNQTNKINHITSVQFSFLKGLGKQLVLTNLKWPPSSCMTHPYQQMFIVRLCAVVSWWQNCVCVNHLNRCKTSTMFLQGGSARLTDTAQRRHCQFVVTQSLISSAYLHQFIISLNGNRLSQEPACRFSTFSTFSNKPSTWCQYGFRNLSGKSICFQPGLWRSSVLTLTRVYSLTQSCQV